MHMAQQIQDLVASIRKDGVEAAKRMRLPFFNQRKNKHKQSLLKRRKKRLI